MEHSSSWFNFIKIIQVEYFFWKCCHLDFTCGQIWLTYNQKGSNLQCTKITSWGIVRFSGNLCNDPIFTFFMVTFYSKLLNMQKVNLKSYSIRSFIKKKMTDTKWKCYIFPPFSQNLWNAKNAGYTVFLVRHDSKYR